MYIFRNIELRLAGTNLEHGVERVDHGWTHNSLLLQQQLVRDTVPYLLIGLKRGGRGGGGGRREGGGRECT